MLSEAQKFWNAISGKVRELVRGETQNAMRMERYDVTTAPNGTVIGVTKPFGTNEIFLPYSSEVSGAVVNDPVLVAWWGSMSNAKVYYYANGYNGGLAAHPVGSFYWSSDPTSPAILFGGTWEQIEEVVLFAASENYLEGTTGGEATHTLTVDELPAHNHFSGLYTVIDRYGSGERDAAGTFSTYGTAINTGDTGNGYAHNNMMPYMAAYCWHRVA